MKDDLAEITSTLGLSNNKTMFRLTILFFIAFFVLDSMVGQDTISFRNSHKLIFSIDFGIQKHDKRLYHWPKNSAISILAKTPKDYGTHQWSISLLKKIGNLRNIEVQGGLGVSRELATFYRPFNQNYGLKFGSYVIRYTDRFSQVLFQTPIKFGYNLFGGAQMAFNVGLLPQFNFFTKANHSTDEINYQPYTWWGFHFYSVEINPEIEFSLWRLHFSIKYRFFQFKKIDPILFWTTSTYVIEKKYETYNPFKLWLSIGYEL